MSRWIVILALTVGLAACGNRTDFRVEPTNRKTFAAERALRKGEVVRLRVTGLSASQRVRFHQCGPKCNSAMMVSMWDATQLPPDGEIIVRVPSDGWYYFWVEDTAPPDGDGNTALVSSSSEPTRTGLKIRYPTLTIDVAHDPRS
jgi:hypothetical protein